MGGGGGGVPATNQAAETAQPQIPVTDFAAFSPGQQGLLAEQMQAGYGGLLEDQNNAMSFYRDMRVPLINSPGDIPNYLKNVGLPVTAGGTPANPAAYYAATQPGAAPQPTTGGQTATPTTGPGQFTQNSNAQMTAGADGQAIADAYYRNFMGSNR